MKNQYFGDNRDLFKYDLILKIIKSGLASHFTFIPMLTPNTSDNKTTRREGERRNRCKAKAGWKNNDLRVFLDKFHDKDKRHIKKLIGFFKEQGIKMTIHHDYFYHIGRDTYFQEAEEKISPESLIFVDPDIGLEVSRTRDKHIRYCEVKNLYDHMDKSSTLMIYQHFPRVEHHEYLYRRTEELTERISGDEPICIDDNEIIFFFLTKNEALEHSLTHLIQEYAESYS